MQRVGDLDIEQDLTFQNRSWALQRVIWGLMALVILLAMLGLFGDGPLSRAVAGGSSKGLWVEYDRFARFQAPTVLKLHLTRQSPDVTQARVWVSNAFLDSCRLARINPEPVESIVESDRVEYVFLLGDPGQTSTVRMFIFPEKPGEIVCRMGLEGEPHLGFTMFAFP